MLEPVPRSSGWVGELIEGSDSACQVGGGGEIWARDCTDMSGQGAALLLSHRHARPGCTSGCGELEVLWWSRGARRAWAGGEEGRTAGEGQV